MTRNTRYYLLGLTVGTILGHLLLHSWLSVALGTAGVWLVIWVISYAFPKFKDESDD